MHQLEGHRDRAHVAPWHDRRAGRVAAGTAPPSPPTPVHEHARAPCAHMGWAGAPHGAMVLDQEMSLGGDGSTCRAGAEGSAPLQVHIGVGCWVCECATLHDRYIRRAGVVGLNRQAVQLGDGKGTHARTRRLSFRIREWDGSSLRGPLQAVARALQHDNALHAFLVTKYPSRAHPEEPAAAGRSREAGGAATAAAALPKQYPRQNCTKRDRQQHTVPCRTRLPGVHK